MTQPTTCRDVHDHASAFVDGEAGDLSALRDHLNRCPPCQEYLRQIGLTVDLLHALPGSTGTEARGKLVDVFKRWCGSRGSSEP